MYKLAVLYDIVQFIFKNYISSRYGVAKNCSGAPGISTATNTG